MGRHWYPVLGCLCLMVSVVFPAAVPTSDTMVVAREDGDSSSTSPVTEPTTEEPAPPVKLTEMDITSNIAMRYAHTAVVTRMRNPAKRAQEATFRVLLPDTAFISSFTMILDGTPYKAYVKEKEEAKQIYTQAVSQGLGAAHVATKARDSNHFMVSVNLEPLTVAVFNLTYEERLNRRNGVYNHAVNVHPGGVVPKLTVTVNIRESQSITDLRVPEVRTGNEVDATADDPQSSIAVIERGKNKAHATITFKPDIEEQKRLIDIYLEKTKETNPRPYRYYGYDEQEEEEDRVGVLGQFVIQYDVDRPQNGEILVSDGYFVHFYAPSDLPPLAKHVVFVLDTSGSMMDRKIAQVRDAMRTILAQLHPGDRFNIVEFASSVKVIELDEANKEPVSPYPNYGYYPYQDYNAPVTLVPPSKATPANIEKAQILVSRLQANGGTNIFSALDVALDLSKRGVGWTGSASSPGRRPAPDAPDAPDASAAPSTAPTTQATEATTKPADTSEVREAVPQWEPMIIFLTDGDPTVGETDPTRIINRLTEKNYGRNKATIYCLAFGEDADRKFLRKLALRNDGMMRHIYEATDAALQLRDFYRQVSSPLLADVKFIYPKNQVKADSLTKHYFTRYYKGSETVVAGRVADGATELSPTVGAFCGTDEPFGRKYIEIMPPSIPVPVTKEKFLPLERMWAYMMVKQLLDARDARDPRDDDADETAESLDKRALDIALKYSFVTPLTSLVVVKPNATTAVNAESVHKQNDVGFGAAVPLSSFMISSNRGGGRVPLSGSAAGPQLASFAFGPPPPQAAYYPAAAGGFAGFPGPPSTPANFARPSLDLASAPAFESLSDPNVAIEADEDSILDTESADPVTSPSEPSPPPTTSTPSPLAPYHLQEYAWLSSLLVGGRVELPANGTTLKLSTDDVAPRAASGKDAECAAAAEGSGEGVCVYLSRCASSRSLTAQTYPAFHCSVDGYAGVCCSKDKVDVETKN